MRKIADTSMLVLLAAFSVWLAVWDRAALPSPLSRAHGEIEECEACHEPWKGVSEEACLQCHSFDAGSSIRKIIRFHEASRYCLSCHRLHIQSRADLSHMDHTLLSGELQCTQCHFDKHEGLFGQECRECHAIRTWAVEGYRHPSSESKECHRCHRAPRSHCEPRFWEYLRLLACQAPVSQNDCWYCHITHDWQERKAESL